MMVWHISNRPWAFIAFSLRRGGALSPPVVQGLMDIAIDSVGADLCVGPWASPTKRRVRADT